MAAVVVKNFKDGEKPNWKHYQVGQVYEGKNEAQLIKDGFIKPSAEVLAEQSKSLEEQIKAAQAKLDALKAKQAGAAKPVVAPKPAAAKPAAPAPAEPKGE